MGKEGDIWDDSNLIKAFDSAISKYKVMHRMSGSSVEEKVNTDKEETLTPSEVDDGSNMIGSQDVNSPNDDNDHTHLEITAKEGETSELSIMKVNSFDFQTEATNGEDSTPNPCDMHSQIETAWYSSIPEYNQLLSKYYELEGQRQQVLQQISQYNNCNYHYTTPDASTFEYQTCVPQPGDTVTCYGPYGSQDLALPINTTPARCSGGTFAENSCGAIPGESNFVNSTRQEGPDFVKTAMLAAERALSSLKKTADEVKDKGFGVEVSDAAEGTKSSTDLDVVLSAWYTAGFYTGKYLAEQSIEKEQTPPKPLSF